MKKVVLLFMIALGAKMLSAQSWQQTFPESLLQSYISEALENNADL